MAALRHPFRVLFQLLLSTLAGPALWRWEEYKQGRSRYPAWIRLALDHSRIGLYAVPSFAALTLFYGLRNDPFSWTTPEALLIAADVTTLAALVAGKFSVNEMAGATRHQPGNSLGNTSSEAVEKVEA